MSRTSKVTLAWGGETEMTFRLRIGELVELQEKCDAGPAFIAERLATNKWRLSDIRETIRLGLIGGGQTDTQALNLVKRYVDDLDRNPLQLNVNIAFAIVTAVLVGVEDEPLGKSAGKRKKKSSQTSPEEKSDLPQSTLAEPS